MTHESTMLERVARAIGLTENGDGFDDPFFESHARAALEAMREPTPAMVGAASVAWNESEAASDEELKAAACRVWQAMIDAALAGEGGG